MGCYRVVTPRGFCAVLPLAVIIDGYPNAGVSVILSSPYRRNVVVSSPSIEQGGSDDEAGDT